MVRLMVVRHCSYQEKEFGIYPPRDMLVELAKMSKAEREEHTLFGVYLWETRKQKVW
jgi:hypothetical protein